MVHSCYLQLVILLVPCLPMHYAMEICFLCFNLRTKWQTLLRMKYVLCSVRKGNTNDMMEKKWICEILHIAGSLNSENPIQIQTETFIKHVLPAKVRAINRLKNTNHRTRKRQEWGGGGLMKKFLCLNEIKNATSIIQQSMNMTLPKDAILNSKFKSAPSILCSSLFPRYCTHKLCKAKLSHKILFEDK